MKSNFWNGDETEGSGSATSVYSLKIYKYSKNAFNSVALHILLSYRIKIINKHESINTND